MKRRRFIALTGSSIAWPLVTRAQQSEPVRRVGLLMNIAEDVPAAQRSVTGFRRALRELGWVEGRNVQIDVRWGAGDRERYRRYASELVTLSPDVLIGATSDPVLALLQVSRDVPIVFVGVIDPVGSGIVANIPRPGGNVTGFTVFEYSLSGKWLELLKEIAPGVKRVAVLRDSALAAGIGQFAAIQTLAPTGSELSTINLRDAGEVERGIAGFAREPNGGLIVTASAFGANNPRLIVELAARHRLPTVYPFRYFVSVGGLLSYGPDQVEQYPTAASYVDRILRGEKPGTMPVQAPTKYELGINLKTAKALGLAVSPSLLLRADDVIE